MNTLKHLFSSLFKYKLFAYLELLFKIQISRQNCGKVLKGNDNPAMLTLEIDGDIALSSTSSSPCMFSSIA